MIALVWRLTEFPTIVLRQKLYQKWQAGQLHVFIFVQGVSKEKRQSFEIETELCGICALEADYLVKEATHGLMDDIDSVKEHDEFHYLNFSCSMPEMMKRC